MDVFSEYAAERFEQLLSNFDPVNKDILTQLVGYFPDLDYYCREGVTQSLQKNPDDTSVVNFVLTLPVQDHEFYRMVEVGQKIRQFNQEHYYCVIKTADDKNYVLSKSDSQFFYLKTADGKIIELRNVISAAQFKAENIKDLKVGGDKTKVKMTDFVVR